MAAKVNSKLRAAFSAHRAAVAKHDVEIPRRRLRMAGFLEKGQMDSFNSEARGLERTEKQLVKAVERAEKLNSEAFAMAAMFGLTVMGTGADATCMSAAALASMQQLTTGLQPGMLGGQPIAGQRAVAPVGVGVPIAAGPVAAYAAAASLPVFAPAVPPMFDADPVEHPMVQPLGRQDYGEHLVSVGSFAPPPPNNPDYIPLPFLPASAFGSQPPPQQQPLQQPLQQPPQQQPQPRRKERQSSELGRELLAEALRTTTACGMVKEGYMLKRGEGDASGFKRRFFRWCAVAELSARALLPSLPLDRVVFRSCSPSALTPNDAHSHSYSRAVHTVPSAAGSGELKYFSDTFKVAKGTIFLSLCTKLEHDAADARHLITVHTPTRAWELRAESASDALEWLRMFEAESGVVAR